MAAMRINMATSPFRSLRFVQNQFNLRFFLQFFSRNEASFALPSARRQNPRDFFHLLQRLPLPFQIVGAITDFERHAPLWIDVLANHQLFAFAEASGDMSSRARLA